MKNIKTIIFDLGGVLINVEYMAPIRAFQKLGVEVNESWYAKATQNALFDDFEKGKISPVDFRNEIRKISGVNLTDDNIDSAWNSILLDFPKERMELLLNLKKKYRLFLLSNTNAIHIREFYNILERTFGKNPFPEIFDHCYYSHEMGLRKPDAEIFERVLKNHGLKPGETFFIDDSPQHVEGALKAGIRAHWLNLENERIIDIINGKLLV
ncbi:MAG: HAD family hydrolase [Flavobacteriales bacterium]